MPILIINGFILYISDIPTGLASFFYIDCLTNNLSSFFISCLGMGDSSSVSSLTSIIIPIFLLDFSMSLGLVYDRFIRSKALYANLYYYGVLCYYLCSSSMCFSGLMLCFMLIIFLGYCVVDFLVFLMLFLSSLIEFCEISEFLNLKKAFFEPLELMVFDDELEALKDENSF